MPGTFSINNTATESTLLKIAPAANGEVVTYVDGYALFATPGVQIFVAVTKTLKYDDDGGNLAQELAAISAGIITSWRITKIYEAGTSATLVAVY